MAPARTADQKYLEGDGEAAAKLADVATTDASPQFEGKCEETKFMKLGLIGESELDVEEDVDELRVPVMRNFITEIIDEDIQSGKHKATHTRFPPEPNGFLHIGHAKSICLNFGLAHQYKGICNLRFDDTNPSSEEKLFIEGIQNDVKWLGFYWGDGNLFYASDYFEQLYDWAVVLIKKGLAYVDHQTEEEVRINRGSLKEPGKPSPYRNRSVEENLELFAKMKAGDFKDGECVLRAKIDMASGNMNLRDPLLYRIKHESHPRTGNKWCLYPIYDYAHGQSDSVEGITHSICTLEFEDHRPLYDWFQENIGIPRTRQIEFARFNLTHTVMSKRRLRELVEKGRVRGWDDPRMPTLAGCRRRGYPPAAIREFAYSIGVAKRENVIPMNKLEGIVRQHLHSVPRRMAVADPLKVTIVNWPSEDHVEDVELNNHPEDRAMGSRILKIGKSIYVDASDFNDNPPPGYHRLTMEAEVKLRGTYWIRCQSVVKDPVSGTPLELLCTYDPDTKNGNPPKDGRKAKGVLHWVSEVSSARAELRLYESLFTKSDPDEGGDWEANLNPQSLVVKQGLVERTVYENPKIMQRYQFERVGFFAVDQDSTKERLVFNLVVSLTDTFAAQTDEASKEARAKEEAKLAREKAAEERRLRKEAKEKKEAEKKASKLTEA